MHHGNIAWDWPGHIPVGDWPSHPVCGLHVEELGVAEGRFLFGADPRQRDPDSEALLASKLYRLSRLHCLARQLHYLSVCCFNSCANNS